MMNIKASAHALVGGTMGLALNFKGGACFLVGFDFGVGASLTIGALAVAPGFIKNEDRTFFIK